MVFDLVFEGGGAKGIVFTGALEELEARGHTFSRLMGVSAGAIVAVGLAAGYSAAEIREALAEEGPDGRPVFMQFLGIPGPFDAATIRQSMVRQWLRAIDIPGLPEWLEEPLDDFTLTRLLGPSRFRQLFSFIEYGGWYTADNFLTWLRQRLDVGFFNDEPRQFSEMNLQEFFEATGKELTILAADTTRARLLVLNHQTAPQCPLIYAVRMSMNVPVLWPEVIWQPEWGLYLGQDISGNVVVDGGLLSNFPIELFITEEPQYTQLMGTKQTDRLIGLLIDEKLEVPGAPPRDGGLGMDLANFRPVRRFLDLVETTTQAHDNAAIEQYQPFVARMPAKGYGTTEFDMTPERREALVNAGRVAMATYLDSIEANPPTTSPALEAGKFFRPANERAYSILVED